MFDWIYLIIVAIVVFLFFYRHSKLDLDGSLFSDAQKSNYYRHGRIGNHFYLPRNNDPKLNIENIYKEAYMETKALQYESEIQSQEEIKPEPAEMPVIKMEQVEEIEEVKTEEVKTEELETESTEKNNLSEERNVDL